MIYLNTEHISAIQRDWSVLTNVIKESIQIMDKGDFEQPIKPYLRYRDTTNRIIAMPAFIGGNINVSGIKWIASFPSNIEKNIKRANSVTILNDADTGVPFCIINTPLISSIRTASVTGLIVQKFLDLKNANNSLTVGICGFGPIGQMHLEMIASLLKDKIKIIKIFDLKPIDSTLIPEAIQDHVIICDNFSSTFGDADIFITSTVSEDRYIHEMPKKGSLHLNISLRDYHPSFIEHVDKIIVDSWDEVCRENTDIEKMHLDKNLKKEDVLDLVDIFCDNKWIGNQEETIMFNPMGLAIFDMAIAKFFSDTAKLKNIGSHLDN